MDTATLKAKVDEEVQTKATQLAVEEVRKLMLDKKRMENLVKDTQETIVELDKKIAEVKVEDLTEDALELVAHEEMGKRTVPFNPSHFHQLAKELGVFDAHC